MGDTKPTTDCITSGPWDIVRSQTCGHLRAAHHYRSDDPRSEFTDADIRLIAAAPELLAALKQCLAYIEQDEVSHGRKFGAGNVARDAIAQAEADPPPTHWQSLPAFSVPSAKEYGDGK